jgi:hypothetical protein
MLMLQVILCFIAQTSLNAQEPPTPQEVANTVSNYWIGQDFTNLSSYVTNLYVTHSNYFPAILAASFHDYIFFGKLADATNKLNRVQQVVNSNPSNFPSEFKTLMEELTATMTWEIDLHSRKGRSPETVQSNASPQAVRSVSGATLLPNINILFYTPATNAP